jgi:hypothetical protein
VFPGKNDKPYFEAWLRRTSRQFAVSGRLTETAMALAGTEGGTVDEWRTRLRIILDGNEVPSLDLLMQIDKLLAGPSKGKAADNTQDMLF